MIGRFCVGIGPPRSRLPAAGDATFFLSELTLSRRPHRHQNRTKSHASRDESNQPAYYRYDTDHEQNQSTDEEVEDRTLASKHGALVKDSRTQPDRYRNLAQRREDQIECGRQQSER